MDALKWVFVLAAWLQLGCSAAASASAASAANGGISGGGGKAVVCSDAAGTIQSVQLLDLFEGWAEQGYTYVESSDAYMDQFRGAVERIEVGGLRGLDQLVDYTDQVLRILPDGTGLLPVDDSYEVIVPKGCQVQQLANFLDDQDKLLVDGSLWAKLTETGKAALLTHEAVYWELRHYAKETNSIRARQAVALAFSGGTFQYYQGGIPSAAWMCQTQFDPAHPDAPASLFWIYNDSLGLLNFQLEYVDDKLMLSRTTAQLDQPVPVSDTSRFVGVIFSELWTHSSLPRFVVNFYFTTPQGADYASGTMVVGSMASNGGESFRCDPPVADQPSSSFR